MPRRRRAEAPRTGAERWAEAWPQDCYRRKKEGRAGQGRRGEHPKGFRTAAEGRREAAEYVPSLGRVTGVEPPSDIQASRSPTKCIILARPP